MRTKVSIIQEVILPYRIPFFRKLKERMDEASIDLDLFYSTPRTAPETEDELPWATPVPIRNVGPFVWQGVYGRCADSQLVIVPQQVRHLSSIAVQFSRAFSKRRHAFWGHGKNMKDELANAPTRAFKRWMSARPDWWFGYNSHACAAIRELGYPKARTTNVMNAIDTRALVEERKTFDITKLDAFREEIGIKSKNVAVYTGGLHPLKRIDFLLESAVLIRERVPDFHLIIIGHGVSEGLVAGAAARYPWIHFPGAKHGLQKVPYWAISKLLLMPGGVGLVALDAIALEVPMITTDNSLHGPEISYLRDKENGLMVTPGDSADTYADAVARVLQNETELARLREGCVEDAMKYSIEDMVDRFTEGVLAALEAPRHRIFF